MREKSNSLLGEKKSWFSMKSKQSIVSVAMLPFPGNIVNENRVGSINYSDFSSDFKSSVCIKECFLNENQKISLGMHHF